MRGRFAPSPTGPLHAGSLVAALASWLDVRARGPNAQWLVRIEDADTERCLPGMGTHMLRQLAACGLRPDEAPVWQTQRTARYEAALEALRTEALAYPCGCSRKDIGEALARLGQAPERHGERVYPGTCRDGLHGKPARAWRFATSKVDAEVRWTDRRLGPQQQDVAREVGDFVLRRADGYWAYQLAVVVDDALQGVTDVVRGADLLHSTPRQVYLQHLLGYPTPRYLHVPVVRNDLGEKLSKQTGAPAIAPVDEVAAVEALLVVAHFLGLPVQRAQSLEAFWTAAIDDWADMLDLRSV